MNPILELQAAMSAANARLTALEKSQTRMLRHIEALKTSAEQGHAATTELRGIFTSIETHLVKLFEEDEQRKADIADLKRRVEALEKRSPAA